MSAEGDDRSAEPEPADDERVLRRRPDTAQDGPGRLDYADVITSRDAAWWATLSDSDYDYGVLRALESASERGAPLHLARCVHHLHDLLSGLDPDDRAWVMALVRRIQGLLARRAACDGTAVTLAALLAYLCDVGADPRFAPPPALPLGLLHRMYPRGVSPAELQEALNRHRYPRGKPLPACPACEPDQLDPRDALARAVAALSAAQRELLTRLGQTLALDGDAPDLIAQLAWVTGAQPMPAPYRDTPARTRGDSDLLEHALNVAEQR